MPRLTVGVAPLTGLPPPDGAGTVVPVPLPEERDVRVLVEDVPVDFDGLASARSCLTTAMAWPWRLAGSGR